MPPITIPYQKRKRPIIIDEAYVILAIKYYCVDQLPKRRRTQLLHKLRETNKVLS